MAHPAVKLRACAAAVCGALSLSAFAQVAVEQARTAAGQNRIERAQGSGLQAGLERALNTPLELVWLRAAAEADMWRNPALAAAVEACAKAGAVRAGCAVVGRTTFRYVFGAQSPFGTVPSDVARLVISALNVPDAPLATGRLTLAGSGRLYLVTPEMPAGMRPAKGAVILAAGSVLQVTDVAAPSIQIELKAPQGEPLLLGNLAAADVGRMLALLVKPSAQNAVEARMDGRGRVALRSGGDVQLAAFLPGAPSRVDAPLQAAALQPVVPARVQPVLAALAPGLEPQAAVAAPRAPLGVRAAPQQPPLAIGGLERNPPRPGESLLLASLAPGALPEPVAARRAAQVPAALRLAQEALHIAAVGAAAMPAEPQFTLAALAPALPAATVTVRAAKAARMAVEPTSVVAPQPIAAAPAPQPAAVPAAVPSAAPSAAPSAELARLRAEVEAEVAREQQRLAQRAQPPRVIGAPTRRFVLGV